MLSETDFPACLDYVRRHGTGEAEGIFGPASLVWRLSRESLTLAAGGRALLLQLAHPAVAEGVAQHSWFQRHPFRRGRRTFHAMDRLVFGDLATALATATALYRLHSRVSGIIQPETSRRLAHTPYWATDPANLLWVWATLMDTAVLAYERLVQPLPRPAKQGLLAEMQLLAVLLGVPPQRVPGSLPEFEAYVGAMLAGQQLEVGSTARTLARQLGIVEGAAASLHRLVTIALLPASLQEAYGFTWTERDDQWATAAWRCLRGLVWGLPPCLRYTPAYHQARVRVARAQRGPVPLASHLVDELMRALPLPFGL